MRQLKYSVTSLSCLSNIQRNDCFRDDSTAKPRVIHQEGMGSMEQKQYYFTCNFYFLILIFYSFVFWAHGQGIRRSQSRDGIRATAATFSHSHSNTGSEPLLRPTLQLTATQDPNQVTPGIEPTSSWILVWFFNH